MELKSDITVFFWIFQEMFDKWENKCMQDINWMKQNDTS